MKFAFTLTQASLLFAAVAFLTLCTSYRASAQITASELQDNIEVSGGYSHVTGDFGLNGFNAGAGLWFNRRVSVNFDFDAIFNTSTLGVLSLTNIGHTAVKNRMQDWLLGPRVFFPSHKINKYKFDPFAEFQIGIAHLSQKIQPTNLPSVSAADTAFAWALGGGADYQFTSQWFGRINLDFFRTHFADQGQSRLRLVLGVGYNFSPRPSSR
jgi:opacity protein-like surface antigen